jgi:hypothetical protein
VRSDVAHFKLDAEILELNCRFEAGKEIEFRYTSPAPVVVSLKQRERLGEDHTDRRGNAVCTATTVRDVEPHIQAEMAQCTDGENVLIDKLAPTTVQLIDHTFDDLRNLSRSTVTIFNWTHGLDSPLDPYLPPNHAWYSEDGNRWSRYSLIRSLTVLVSTRIIHAENVQIDEVMRKIEAGAEEPLGRQLFREAWSQVRTNPRSALVIGVAAAEVGLKRLTGILMPEIQTPRVGKILRDLLPTLATKAKARWLDGGQIELPITLIDEFVKALNLRNKVVHEGAPAPSRQELSSMLRAISDILWMCDIYLGEHWAAKHISPETVKNWQPKSS